MSYPKGASLGYRLHVDTSHGPIVPLDGVPHIPKDARDWIDRGAEERLPAALVALCDKAIAAAKQEINARKLAAKLALGAPRIRQGKEERDDE